MSGSVRKVAVVLPTIITLALVALAGAAILVHRQDSSDELRRAEEAGSAYFSDVATFESRVRTVLTDGKKRKPAELRRIIDAELQHPPRLGSVPEGASRSRTYREAVKKSVTVLDPYRDLSRALGRSAEAEPFVDAADDALAKSPGSLAGFLVFESGPLRREVLPELNRARETFRRAKVPKGAEDAARTVDSAVSFAIGQIDVMARRADAGQSYEFDYSDEYEAAAKAVKDYAIEVDADLAEAVDRVAGDRAT